MCIRDRNVGTTFTVTIPFEIAPQEAVSEVTDDSAVTSIRGVKILLAEDNDLNLEIVTELLEQQGAIITPARNGKEAVTIFENNAPGTFDVILMDIMMPVMDGLEACRTIRSLNRPDASTIPVIALTANAFFEDAKKCLDAGMNAHLTKPIDMKKMTQTIGNFIK